MTPMQHNNGSARKAILTAWLAAGSFDILSAFTHSIAYGGSAMGVLRAVASGLIGKQAVGGGWAVASLGMFLHYAIMLVIVLVFWAASRRFSFLLKRPLLIGPLYGICVFAVMNVLVLPLSQIIFTPRYDWPTLLIGICIHMVAVGLPIATVFHYYAHSARAAGSATAA
ncbi:MAG: hypothetical protein ABI905_13965 [Betaproteobacteria bacterium]